MSRTTPDPVDVQRRDGDPAQFLWRGRLYLVLAVLARWTETGRWWRVEAAAGSASRPGVYDLCLDAGAWSLARAVE